MIDKNIDREILEYIMPNGVYTSQRALKSVMEKHGWLDYLLQRYTDNSTDLYTEILYRFRNNIEVAPVCKACGKPVKFYDGKYPTFCCAKCRNNDPEVKAKNISGVKKSLKNAYATRSDEIKSKRAKTLSEKYGNESTSCSPFAYKQVQDKIKDTVYSHYGVTNVMELPEYHTSAKEIGRKFSIELWKSRGYDIEYTDHDTVIIKNGCSVHGDIELSLRMFNNRLKEDRRNISDICPICNKEHLYSGEESMLAKFFDANNIVHEDNTRKIITPLELDFYLPDYNLAIEMNGLAFHNEFSDKDKTYHLHKTELCQEKGIQLIHIWESDWIAKNELVMSMLKNKLNLVDDKIYARNCIIKEVSSKDANKFLTENHLQGSINSKYRFGLYYNDELVSLITFGKLRKVLGAKPDNTCCELYRFCNKLNTNVIGGASKLFKYAVSILKADGYKQILTYAKRDWSSGKLYDTLGFNFIGYTVPGYFWTNRNGDTKTRWSCRKSEIAKTEEEKKMTEVEIMHAHKYFRCYDTGNLKYIYDIV